MLNLYPSSSRAGTQASSADGHIDLTDNTVPSEPAESPKDDGGDGGTVTKMPTKPGALSRIGTANLREQIARRKYTKYQEQRYLDSEQDSDSGPAPVTRTTSITNSGGEQAAGASGAEAAPLAIAGRTGTLRRGRERVKGLFGRKRTRRVKEGDAQIDVLSENQRGTFLFGMPFYSSNSLLNFDPPAWTTAEGKPSPVDITNAQLPDPNWEWVWNTWYVDMSGDVDEQGWQYSFMFQTNFSWHGTHPWFHSFVRRRCWIRKRVRKHRHLPDGRVEGGRTMQDAHKLNEDYFTIHSSRGRSPDSSYPPSTSAPSSLRQPADLEDATAADEDIENIKALMARLKRATIDREKIAAVLKFMDQGGQETYYLADEIPHIMSLFIFEHSRRQLAVAMLRKVDGKAFDQDRTDPEQISKRIPTEEQGKRPGHQDPPADKSQEYDAQKQYLVRAIKAAEEGVKHLEYWSDIRHIVEKGDTLTGSDLEHGWDETWQGLGSGGPAGSMNESDPAARNKRVDKGKGKA